MTEMKPAHETSGAESCGWPITLEEVLAAEKRIRPHLPPTPLRSYGPLNDALGMHVLVKHEHHQPTNAFKVRNGLSVITAMTPSERARGVVAASMGNYGLGLAWAGRRLGVGVTICVPTGVNSDKLTGIRDLGAELMVEGSDFDEATEIMERLVHDRGLYPAHGVNHPQVLAGAGTMTLEILEQATSMGVKLDAMVLGIGGGSQAVGAMTMLRGRGTEVRVHGVQAQGAPTIHDAWQRRKPCTGPPPQTFAEGLATRQTYPLTFDALCAGLAGFHLVDDTALADAMRLIWRTSHQFVEPAGAAGIAALSVLRRELAGQTVGVALTGANVDLATLRRVVDEAI